MASKTRTVTASQTFDTICASRQSSGCDRLKTWRGSQTNTEEPCIESIFEEVILALADQRADVVLIGGLAVILHGGSHFTKDIDFALIRRRENAQAIARALAPFHPRPYQWPADLPFVWDAETVMRSTVLTLDTDICRIDFLAEPDGAPPFQKLKENAAQISIEGRTIYVAAIDDLISMKRAAGRAQDHTHIAELETIKKLISETSNEPPESA